MDNRKLGSKIRKLRKEKGLTIAELGKLVGMSNSTVCMWEKGLRRPEVEGLQKLAELFDKPVSFFLEDNEENVVTILGRNGLSKKFILSEKDLRAVEALAESLTSSDPD